MKVVQDCYDSTPLIFLFEIETLQIHTQISHVRVSSLSVLSPVSYLDKGQMKRAKEEEEATC